jgi:ADP-heptose:LPS heptosyltransferase
LLKDSAGLSILINGTARERQYFAPLLQGSGVYSLFGSSLPTLATALINARALVTVDTGTMHLATALGTPVLALFGPSNPVLTGPYSRKVPNNALVSGVDCQPCVKTTLQKQCSFNRCMAELVPEQVFVACQQLIRS